MRFIFTDIISRLVEDACHPLSHGIIYIYVYVCAPARD